MSVRISQLGYRKDEPNRIKAETPKMLQWIIDLYIRDRGYTVTELSAAMLCLEDEFRRNYLRDEDDQALRVIG